MNQFLKRTALRIAAVSIALASIASPVAWFVARESAEESVVSLAIEESARVLHYYRAVGLESAEGQQNARKAADTITGGLFDIAEIYDPQGHKVAESMSEQGAVIEPFLAPHGAPQYQQASYESVELSRDWVLRVFVPLRDTPGDSQGAISGYF